MSYDEEYPRQSPATVKEVNKFLFQDLGKSESQQLDVRSDMSSKGLVQAITHYRIIEETYKSEAAKRIANILERLSIAMRRGGRLEAVAVLRSNLPPETTMISGEESELNRLRQGQK